MTDRWSRRAPLTGLLFVGLLVATFALSWNSPDDKASPAKVIAYFHAHRSQEMVANVLGVYAVVFWLFFTSALRSFLRRAGVSEGLATTAFAGAVVFGVGGALLSAVGFTLANEVNRMTASDAHTLNLLSGGGLFFPLAAGQAVFAIATALAILRTRVLPVALGWIALLLGLIAITPVGFFGTFALLIWAAIVSVMVYVRGERLVGAPAVAAPREPVGAALG